MGLGAITKLSCTLSLTLCGRTLSDTPACLSLLASRSSSLWTVRAPSDVPYFKVDASTGNFAWSKEAVHKHRIYTHGIMRVDKTCYYPQCSGHGYTWQVTWLRRHQVSHQCAAIYNGRWPNSSGRAHAVRSGLWLTIYSAESASRVSAVSCGHDAS